MKTKSMTQTAIIAAVIFAFAFLMPFLAYPKIGVVEITLLMIPVIVGAVVIGPAGGAVAGTCFGITSFLQCLGFPMLSTFGATMLSDSVWKTALLTIGARALAGYLCGVVAWGLKKAGCRRAVFCTAAALCGSLFNTVFFVGGLYFLFSRSETVMNLLQIGRNLLAFFVALVGVNSLIEAVVCTAVGAVIANAVLRSKPL